MAGVRTELILVNEVPTNTSYPIFVTLFGIVKLVNEVQPFIKRGAISVILLGIVIFVNDMQL